MLRLVIARGSVAMRQCSALRPMSSKVVRSATKRAPVESTSTVDAAPLSSPPPLKPQDVAKTSTSSMHEIEIYNSHLAPALRKLKLLSIASCAATVLGAPVVTSVYEMPLLIQSVIIASMSLVGVGTTALLHWITKPFVCNLVYLPATQSLRAETLTLRGHLTPHHFDLSDVQPGNPYRPFSIFSANGKDFMVDIEQVGAGPFLSRIEQFDGRVPQTVQKKV